MIVHTAHLSCRPEMLEAFRARLLLHAATTIVAEPGCLRFDIHQDREVLQRFLLVEVYRDDDALAAHRASPHYLSFREDTKDQVTSREWWFWNALNPVTD